MAKDIHGDPSKEKFRTPAEERLDQEIDQLLGNLSVDELYDSSPTQQSPQVPAAGGAKGMKRGRVVSVDEKGGFVFVDMGGKSQGMAEFSQFEGGEIPKAGDEMEFIIERFEPREGLLILARKGAASSNVSWENLQVGQTIEGTVTAVNKGGLELTVKNMRAFMPSGQVDTAFHQDLNVFMGQKLTAEVMQFEREARNLVVSRRVILEREKEASRQKMLNEIAVDQIRRGTVRAIMDFGAFVDLGGLDGLLHVSEITHRRGIKIGDFIKVGDVVDVKVIRFDRETGKMSLSLKQMMADPWQGAEAKYATGTPVTGRVTRVENFGAFVEVEEGIEGLLPISEMSYQRIKHPSDIVKEGDTLRLVVINFDPEAKKLSFSLKQAGPDPWQSVEDRFPRDSTVTGHVSRVVDFGAFVELEPGLEGLVHISELSNTRVRTPADVVKPGQEVKVRVIEVDKTSRRIGLSIKRAEEATAVTAPATTPTATSKKKRPQLRGGLDR